MHKYSHLIIINHTYFLTQHNMKLSLLQIILISSVLVLLYILFDAWRRKKLRIFHFLVFAFWLSAILITSFNPNILQQLWSIVWVERGADFIVYMAIIFLGFVFLSLLQNLINQQQEITRLCTWQALREYKLQHKQSEVVFFETPTITAKDSYLFLIRAYNEASVLRSVIDEIITAGYRKIVIVNDGSKDNTEQVIDMLRSDYTWKALIVWLHHSINRGPWAANKTLFAFASQYMRSLWCEWCVTYDADGQMSIEDMNTFMTYADHTKYDVIIGSRFVAWASTHAMPFLRRIILRGARVVTYIFNGLRVTDVPTGYRMYHRDIIWKIKLVSDRFSYQNDIIESIRHHHLRFVEVPVHIKYTPYSLQKWQSNMSALKIIIRLVYSSLFNR